MSKKYFNFFGGLPGCCGGGGVCCCDCGCDCGCSSWGGGDGDEDEIVEVEDIAGLWGGVGGVVEDMKNKQTFNK